jgi:hypothetical protein
VTLVEHVSFRALALGLPDREVLVRGNLIGSEISSCPVLGKRRERCGFCLKALSEVRKTINPESQECQRVRSVSESGVSAKSAVSSCLEVNG